VFTRDHVSVMSGITMDGHLYTLVREEALDSLDSVLFFKHLLPHVSEHLLVIWDGSPIHKGHVMAISIFLSASMKKSNALRKRSKKIAGLGEREEIKHN
jgi:hypothetical protein